MCNTQATGMRNSFRILLWTKWQKKNPQSTWGGTHSGVTCERRKTQLNVCDENMGTTDRRETKAQLSCHRVLSFFSFFNLPPTLSLTPPPQTVPSPNPADPVSLPCISTSLCFSPAARMQINTRARTYTHTHTPTGPRARLIRTTRKHVAVTRTTIRTTSTSR